MSLIKLIPEVVRHPHFEVPYPQLKRGQQSLGALVAVVRPFRYIYTIGLVCLFVPRYAMSIGYLVA